MAARAVWYWVCSISDKYMAMLLICREAAVLCRRGMHMPLEHPPSVPSVTRSVSRYFSYAPGGMKHGVCMKVGIRSCMRPMNTQCKNLSSRVLSRLLVDPSVNACHPILLIYFYPPHAHRISIGHSLLQPSSPQCHRSQQHSPTTTTRYVRTYSPPPTRTNTSTTLHPILSRWVVASDWPLRSTPIGFLHSQTGRRTAVDFISPAHPLPRRRHDTTISPCIYIHTCNTPFTRSCVRGDWLTSTPSPAPWSVSVE